MLMCNSLGADGKSGDLARAAMQSMSDLLNLELLLTKQISDELFKITQHSCPRLCSITVPI